MLLPIFVHGARGIWTEDQMAILSEYVGAKDVVRPDFHKPL